MKILNKILTILILLAILTCGISFVVRKTIPHHETLLPEISKLPVQTETQAGAFDFSYQGTTFNVIPQADYELWGLVVTHNNIGGIMDAYHTKKSVDLKDICVVFGNNAKTGVYEKGKYKSGSWTCYWQFADADSWSRFSESQIANNHLITSDKTIQNQIRHLKVGDQVHLKGNLVNYNNSETGWERKTSLTRKDTGNHACEVVFVKELNVLQSPNKIWYLLFYWSKIAILGLIVLKLIVMHLVVRKDLKNLTSKKEA